MSDGDDETIRLNGDPRFEEMIRRGTKVQEFLNNWSHHYRSPAELASLFQRQGIKGVQRENCTCPVAVAMKKELGFGVVVSTVSVKAHPAESFVMDNPHRGITYARLPQVVRDFVRMFDNGMFPDLVEPEPPTGG